MIQQVNFIIYMRGIYMKKAMVLLVTLVTTTNVLAACGNSSKENKVSKVKVEQSSNSKKKTSSKKQKESSSQETSEASVDSSSSVQTSQSQTDSSDQDSQSTSESDQHAPYSIVGVWQDKRESSSKLTFKADGSFEKYSAAAGFKTTGTYQIVSQQDDNVTVSMSLKYPNGQTEEQNAQYKFTNENILVAGNQQYERSN